MQLKYLSVLCGASRQSFVRNSLMGLVAGMVGAYPYPILITQAEQNEDTVYWLTRVMNENYDTYKDADPSAIG